MQFGDLAPLGDNSWITPVDKPDPEVMPKVKGWNLLIRPVPVEEKAGSIHLPDSFQDDLRYATNIGQVLAKGIMCYSDREKYGDDWCEVGDYVVWAKNQGKKFKYGGVAYVLLADDLVLMTVEDPALMGATANLLNY